MTVEKVEKARENIRADIEKHRVKLAAARKKYRTKKIMAISKGTPSVVVLANKAHDEVVKNVLDLEKLRRKMVELKSDLKTEKILQRVKKMERQAAEKLSSFEQALTKQAEIDLLIAREKYEKRWLKKRRLSDARKLRAEERKRRAKLLDIDRKAQKEIRTISRKVADTTSKPIAAPGRSGRLRKESSQGNPTRGDHRRRVKKISASQKEMSTTGALIAQTKERGALKKGLGEGKSTVTKAAESVINKSSGRSKSSAAIKKVTGKSTAKKSRGDQGR